MKTKYLVSIFTIVLGCCLNCYVQSASIQNSPSNSKPIATVDNSKSLASPNSDNSAKQSKKSPPRINRQTEGENDIGTVPEEGAPAEGAAEGHAKPPRNGLPYFPSFNKPFEEFQADLDKIMEHINAGLEKVVEGFHELVHDPATSHDKFFITAADPELFKNMIAKYDEQQAKSRALLEERKANNTAEAAARRARKSGKQAIL